MSKPLSWGMPRYFYNLILFFSILTSFLFSDKVCEKLKKTDRQICELTYEKQIDFSTVDLKKLKVKDLKKILSEWDEVCKCGSCLKLSLNPNYFRSVMAV